MANDNTLEGFIEMAQEKSENDKGIVVALSSFMNVLFGYVISLYLFVYLFFELSQPFILHQKFVLIIILFSDAINESCNPLQVCCPRPLPNGLSDCKHGYRILKNGSKFDCIPERCTNDYRS